MILSFSDHSEKSDTYQQSFTVELLIIKALTKKLSQIKIST